MPAVLHNLQHKKNWNKCNQTKKKYCSNNMVYLGFKFFFSIFVLSALLINWKKLDKII